jgi:Cft2 family RNA processing exonuclease
VEIEFVGAAREVTGSCHILRVAGKTVVLDCGLFQGKRNESHEKNLRLPVPIDQIDTVVLSHAHIDHAGRLPFLVRHGYQGTIWCTPATRDLCAVMLADSAHIQEVDFVCPSALVIATRAAVICGVRPNTRRRYGGAQAQWQLVPPSPRDNRRQ